MFLRNLLTDCLSCMKYLVVFILFILSSLYLNGGEARSELCAFAEKYLLKSGEKFAIETMELAFTYPQMPPAEDMMLLQIFVRMNYDDYDFSKLDKFSKSRNLQFSRDWRMRWKNDPIMFSDFKDTPEIVEFKREALANKALGRWIDLCASGERKKWAQTPFSRNLIRRCIEGWTLSRAVEAITYRKDDANEFCEPYEAEMFLYWLVYIRLAGIEDFCESRHALCYYALFFEPKKIKDPLRKLRKRKILPDYFKENKRNYSLWVDEYRDYMLALKTLIKPIKSGEDPMTMHNRAIEYTLRKIKEWHLSDRSAARNTNP